MTPEELRSFMAECELEPSAIAFNLGIERPRIREYLGGNVKALTPEFQSSIRDRLVVPEHRSVANREEYSAVIDAVGEFVAKHSVHYHYEKKGDRKTASGTLVQIGNRTLIATTRHTIPSGSEFLECTGGNISYVEQKSDQETGRSSWTGASQIKYLNHGRHKTLDVGFLELDRNATAILKRDPISLANITVRPPQYGRIACVFGYPFEMERRLRLSQSRGAILISSLTYPNPVLAPEEWPNVPTANLQPQEGVDCFLRYSRDDLGKLVVPLSGTVLPDSLKFSDKLPAVHGMSGGGFWQSWKPARQDGVWTPSGYQLFAIQQSWYEPERYIRGIQVRHWLELVANAYEELRPMIEDHVKSASNVGQALPDAGLMRTTNDH